MRRHLREMLAEFDYVLLDTSSASVHSDAVALGPLVNAVVLIVGANATRREVAKRAIDRLHAANVKVLGAILTNRDFPIPETLYRLL
jgi:Mrp family chromosome partitioning ATPase